jgi:hypothetical protein
MLHFNAGQKPAILKYKVRTKDERHKKERRKEKEKLFGNERRIIY